MDSRVFNDLKLAFACDVYETIKAARKVHDTSVFRHTMADENGQMVFVGLFPKKEIMDFPNLTDEFISKLQTFNLLGVVTDGKSGLDMFLIGGQNKPFTQCSNGQELARCFVEDALVSFLQMYFDVKGIMLDFTKLDHEAFLKAVESEVFKNTSFAQMHDAQVLLSAYKS